MSVRLLKIALVVLVGLQGLIYFAGNILDWNAALGAVTYVLSQQGHEVYPGHIVPEIPGGPLPLLALIAILIGEFLVGLLSFKGAFDLWRVRSGSAAAFQEAKTFALLGAGMGVLVWFGLFLVVGTALFQMWQTQAGANSMNGAFIFAMTSGLVLLFVNQPEQPA